MRQFNPMTACLHPHPDNDRPLAAIGSQQQAAVANARRARAEEDTRVPVYTAEQEAALMTARRSRTIARELTPGGCSDIRFH